MNALRRSACGGCRLDLQGERLVARVSGALWLPETRTLAAGDLHLEKGSAFGARGQLLPPYDTAATLDRLLAEVEALTPERLVLMGDSFHDRGAVGRLDQVAVARLKGLSQRLHLVWLSGNHDPEPPEGLAGETVDQIRIGSLILTHEPSPDPVDGEVAGHLHPVATVRGYGTRVRRRCFLTDGRRMILPAFGAYAGGLNVTDPAFRGLFAEATTALIMGDDRVHAMPVARLTVGV
jgi:DNA ligase-associated metallophosphoesterase